MYSKYQLNEKLLELLDDACDEVDAAPEYSGGMGGNQNGMTPSEKEYVKSFYTQSVDSLVSVIATYFSPGSLRTKDVIDLVISSMSLLMSQKDIPQYSSIRALFNGGGNFSSIMSLTSISNAGWHVRNPNLPAEHPVLAPIGVAIAGAEATEHANIENIIMNADIMDMKESFKNIFEPPGENEPVVIPDMADIAQTIFITKGVKDIIEEFELDIYIPTYLA